jgi:excisionase family DNA binding protein
MAITGLPHEPLESSTATVEPERRPERTNEDLQELLTVDDVAALLKVSRSWVYEHTRSRGTPRTERLPHVKVGKYLRFEARAIRAFIEKKCRTT